MAKLQEYHRPASVDEALALLASGRGRLLPLAGGTMLVGQLETRARVDVQGVVDLRDAGLGTIRDANGQFRVGAMCTLASVTEHLALRALADGLLIRAARAEGPPNLRNAATVGGVVACAEYDSEFYTALLALGATVKALSMDGAAITLPLAHFEASGVLVTEVLLRTSPSRGGAARVARTPSDRPIVAAYAIRRTGSSEPVRVALCGVSSRPMLSGQQSEPPDNFKGSAAYRLAMADVVAQRAVAETEKVDSHAG